MEGWPTNQLQSGTTRRKPEAGPAMVVWASTLMSNLPANQHQSDQAIQDIVDLLAA
jgi:hypothetical protein